jgi:hypothetical protein
MLARQSVAPPPLEAAELVKSLMDHVEELNAAHAAVASAIAGRQPPPPVHAPIDVDHLDSQSRRLAEHPPLDDPWAARGVVDILRTRALIAEITLSLVRLRDLVGATIGSPAEPELAVSVAPATT